MNHEKNHDPATGGSTKNGGSAKIGGSAKGSPVKWSHVERYWVVLAQNLPFKTLDKIKPFHQRWEGIYQHMPPAVHAAIAGKEALHDKFMRIDPRKYVSIYCSVPRSTLVHDDEDDPIMIECQPGQPVRVVANPC